MSKKENSNYQKSTERTNQDQTSVNESTGPGQKK